MSRSIAVVILMIASWGCSSPSNTTQSAPIPNPDEISKTDPAAEQKAVQFVEKLGGTVERDEKLKLPGNPIFKVSLVGTKVTDADIKELAAFKGLLQVELGETKLTDAGVKELTVHKNLLALGLRETLVTDVGLKDLATLKKLTTLSLKGCKVTDAGVKELQAALPDCTILK